MKGETSTCGFSAKVLDPEGYAACCAALGGSLDAVARIEAPLRERGWEGPDVISAKDGWHLWQAGWFVPCSELEVVKRAPTEPRARLLAVLKAMLHEALTHTHEQTETSLSK